MEQQKKTCFFAVWSDSTNLEREKISSSNLQPYLKVFSGNLRTIPQKNFSVLTKKISDHPFLQDDSVAQSQSPGTAIHTALR